LPETESIFLVNPQGYNSASSRMYPMPAYDDRDRDYYKDALSGDPDLFVSPPFAGKAAGTVAFTISRGLHRDGAFNGLVAVTLHPSYFQGFYSAVLKNPNGTSATLMRKDGVVLVRSPEPTKIPAVLPADSTLMQMINAGTVSGMAWTRPSRSGIIRLIAFQAVPGSSLIVTYGRDASAVLSPWYFHVTVIAALAALAAASLFFAVWGATARYERQQANLHALLAEQERRRKAEDDLQKAQRLEALGRLTGGLAHDFNNILAGLLGALQILRRYVEDPKGTQVIEHGIAAANRGAQITAQMLTFAQRRVTELSAVNLADLVGGLDDLIRRTAGPLVRVSYDIDPAAALAMSDPSQLELALLNLVANGRDAMPLGGALTISVTNASAGEVEYVAIAVSDTGTGMSEDIRARAFEPFFTTKAPGKGTGLGLANVYGMVTQAGGHAAIESVEGKGTTVRLYLPRAGALAQGTAAAPMEALPEYPCLRIMLVDDDSLVRETTEAMLREAGHEVVSVAGAREALDRLQGGGAVDLLVVDYAMPLINGAQLASDVKRLRPLLPIVFVTGYMRDEGLRIWAETGHIVLQKPFSYAQLATAIRDAIENAESAAKVVPLANRA
ncbi:MAG TPA: ATP-binding protein, partial [Bauldia sp.]|nr:ATP-binding protein [Bauldia sp.]